MVPTAAMSGVHVKYSYKWGEGGFFGPTKYRAQLGLQKRVMQLKS